MKMVFLESILLAGLLGCCSGSQAGANLQGSGRAATLPVARGVEVRETQGVVEYAYDGTGWRTLEVGKELRAGATIRAGEHSAAIVQVDHRTTLVKICPETMLHLTLPAPSDEASGLAMAAP